MRLALGFAVVVSLASGVAAALPGPRQATVRRPPATRRSPSITPTARKPPPAAPLTLMTNGFTVSVNPRTVRIGELAILTWTSERPLTTASVQVFDRSIPAFEVEPGRWRALIGVDLDQRAGMYPAEIVGMAPSVQVRGPLTLDVRPRVFEERRLRVAPDFVNPPAGMLARIERERALTDAAYAGSADRRLWHQPFVRPVPHAANSRFGTRSVYNGERRSPHAGTDFLSPAGTPIHAPNAGRVVVARDLYFTGNTVIIDHGLGLLSVLAHMSRLEVSEGAAVERDQVVGLVGATGRVTGPHLHWSLAVSGARVDPVALLALLGPGSATP